MAGKRGLGAWRWLFIIEGTITVRSQAFPHISFQYANKFLIKGRYRVCRLFHHAKLPENHEMVDRGRETNGSVAS